MNYRAEKVSKKWPKKHRSWNQQLIPKRLIELAKRGEYHESYLIK